MGSLVVHRQQVCRNVKVQTSHWAIPVERFEDLTPRARTIPIHLLADRHPHPPSLPAVKSTKGTLVSLSCQRSFPSSG